MAGASMKDIKRRIRSVESTMQITKAMQLVAASKLRKAREGMESSRPFFGVAKQALSDVVRYSATLAENRFTRVRADGKTLFIVIAGDRGLAGGYNSNIFKLVAEQSADGAPTVIPIGKKAMEKYRQAAAESTDVAYARVEGLRVNDCFGIADTAIQGFLNEKWARVCVVYTNFASMLSQEAMVDTLLPLPISDERPPREQMVLEPEAEALFTNAVRVYMAGMIYSAACNSFASEMGARRNAMDNATRNAGEMIENLKLNYNRARQGAITQELTEIVAGAEQ